MIIPNYNRITVARTILSVKEGSNAAMNGFLVFIIDNEGGRVNGKWTAIHMPLVRGRIIMHARLLNDQLRTCRKRRRLSSFFTSSGAADVMPCVLFNKQSKPA
jgi:hypothetical protein